MSGAPRARVRIGASPLAAPHIAAPLAGARRANPRIEASLQIRPRADIDVAVAAGDLDIGLVDGIAAPSDPLHLTDAVAPAAIALAERPLALVLPSAHPLASRRGIDLHDLVDALWLDVPDVAVPLPALRRATGSRDGFPASLTCEGGDLPFLISLVAAGHGLAVLPAGATGDAPGMAAGVAEVPVHAPRLVHRTELLHARATDPATAAFLAALG
jgi:DNA-binding transcriptional LysR family regulator